MNLKGCCLLAGLAATATCLTANEGFLPRSTPEAEGISSTALLSFLDRVESEIDALHSVVVLRHGRVVAEGWWAPYGEESPHDLHSLSKSFTSTAIGMAVDEGLLSLDDTVLGFFQDKAPAEPSDNLKAMRIRQLLTMTSGHGENTMGRLIEADGEDWVRGFLSLEVEHKPGTHFLYNTGASFMLSAILQQVAGVSLRDYLVPRLFEPLGIVDVEWESNPQGITMGGFGLRLDTREIARFGQLYLQRGRWGDRQLVPADWVAEATTKQTSNGCYPDSDWDQGYGYQFWRCRHGLYRGDGAFGQFCIVMPEQDAVVAITSGTGDMQGVMNAVWETLLPAMGDAPLAEDAALSAALQARLAGLRLTTQEGEADSPMADAVRGRAYELSENPMGWVTATLDFSGGEAVLVLVGASAEHRFRAGFGEWVEGISNLGDRGPMPMAASGAWIAPDTFVVRGYLTGTAFRNTATLKFEGEQLALRLEQNVGFGANEPLVIRGRARPAGGQSVDPAASR